MCRFVLGAGVFLVLHNAWAGDMSCQRKKERRFTHVATRPMPKTRINQFSVSLVFATSILSLRRASDLAQVLPIAPATAVRPPLLYFLYDFFFLSAQRTNDDATRSSQHNKWSHLPACGLELPQTSFVPGQTLSYSYPLLSPSLLTSLAF